jgi:glucokinase
MEAVASVPAIIARANELAFGDRFSSLAEVMSSAKERQGVALKALREAAADLGLGLSTLVHLLGPERILLGGGGFDVAGEVLLPDVKDALMAHIQPFFAERLRVSRAGLGNDAGIVGAAALGM